jgi:hypothetical protein
MTTPDRLDDKALAAANREFTSYWNGMDRPLPELIELTIRAYFEALATPVPGAVSNAMVKRPASVQAAFEVFEGKPDTGPHATALFRYVEELERILSSLAPVEAPGTSDD